MDNDEIGVMAYNKCSSHYVKTSSIEKLLLSSINEICKVLNEFIERVEVNHHMTQQIDLYFNFIGQVPATDNGTSYFCNYMTEFFFSCIFRLLSSIIGSEPKP